MLGCSHQMGMIPLGVAVINGRQRARKLFHLLFRLVMPRALVFNREKKNKNQRVK